MDKTDNNLYKRLIMKDKDEWDEPRYTVAMDALNDIMKEGCNGVIFFKEKKLIAIASYTERFHNYIDLNWLASNKGFPYSGKHIILVLANKASIYNKTLRIHSSESALGYYKKIGLTAPDPTFPSLFELTPEQARNFK